MEESPLIVKPDIHTITPEDEEWMAKEALINPVVFKFYHYYKIDATNAYKQAYKAMVATLSKVAAEISKAKKTEDQIKLVLSLDKMPKVIESYRLLSEGKGYDSLSQIQEAPEISGKDIVKEIRKRTENITP